MPAPRALIVASGSNREEECIAASVALRQAGYSVELDVSGRDERSALAYAAERKIACVILIGADKSKKGQARIRRVGGRGEELMPIASLAGYLKGESGAAGAAP